ncbi:acyl-CoA dehydrogenase family protein [Streptosporangium sp. NPDC002544]|uniref:acyl-CoA dehydrogenase family protein n=1 Tax=Streptosporangium sp. NPDC002544 TaxID=3154538 RepID=UPI00331A2D39
MTLVFTEEHEALRGSVRAFLEDRSPESEVRRLAETADGFDPGVWEQMSQMLGLPGLIVPEELDGAGAGYVELGIVLEEMGRALLPAPFFSTVVLGVNALLLSGDGDAQKAYLPSIAAGRLRATLAVAEARDVWSEQAIETRATRSGDTWVLDGVKDFVLDGATAELVLVVARAEDGVGLFAVDAGAAGLTSTPLETLDQTRRQARLTFASTPATLVGETRDGWRVVAEVLDRALVALAAEQVGGAQKVLEMAVGYAATRVQFGRQIGSFQAIKHRCADMLIDVERAKAAMYQALWTVDHEPAETSAAAALAKAFCSEAYFDAASSNIQVHGGIGYTWEHPAHLYFRRAKSSQLLFGTPGHHREVLLQKLAV